MFPRRCGIEKTAMKRPSELTTEQLGVILGNLKNLGADHITEDDVLTVFWAALVSEFIFVPAKWLDTVYRSETFKPLITEEDIIFGPKLRHATKKPKRTTVSKLAHYIRHPSDIFPDHGSN